MSLYATHPIQRSKPEVIGVDLFCGVGGLTHGLIRGGIRVTAGVDIDPNCRYPFKTNNSAEFLERDITKLTAEEIIPYYDGAEFTLLSGCAPCQPFSTYSRSGRSHKYELQWPLVSVFGRLVNQIQPDLVTMENVPQLAEHPVFRQLLDNLTGYEIWFSVVQCVSVGVPQSRRRLVLLASKLPSTPLMLINDTTKLVTVRQTIAGLPPLKAGDHHPDDVMHRSSTLSPLNLSRIKASRPGGTWRDWPLELRSKCHLKATGKNYSSVYGRMEWDQPAPTITTQCFGYGNGRFGHPEQDRAISLREAAMLQTFPETYKFAPDDASISFSQMGRLIGNAVPVRLGEVVAQSLLEHLHAYQAQL